MVVSVREMAEAAVGAIEWNYQRMVGKAVDKEWECAEVEKELQSERKENSRLRAIIAMYEQAFCQLHQQKIEDGYFSEELSMEAYKKLKLNVESAAFLEKPKLSSANASNGMSSESISVKAEGGMLLRPDVDDLDGWLWLSETALVPSGDHKEVKDCVGADGYVLINQEDIVDSIASFMACYISSIPQAKNLSTKELQDAITQAFKKVEKKGKIHQLWETGKFLYTAGSWGATALSIYGHPIVIRAASMAMWTSFWLIVKVVT
ncbi:unnamed protein product [Sphagnum jensenii]|uniref:Uncharacterized protein n=1 Tax=Sphagnum jensenii TaxID=128206 RepID=A0ABP0X387_9BRYO